MKKQLFLLTVLFFVFLVFITGCATITDVSKFYNRKGDEINEDIFTVIFPE